MDTIGKRIRFVRGSLSQAEFSAKTGLNKSTLGRYERDLNSPDAKAIEAISGAFLIRSEWLVTGRGSPEQTTDGSKLVGTPIDAHHTMLVETVNGEEYNRGILEPLKSALHETLHEQRIQITERHFQAISFLLYEEFVNRVISLTDPLAITLSRKAR